MKLLCVSCDEAMKFKEAMGPHEGSMTVLFQCPKCLREFALLTNPFETQLVRALDVKIGGRSVPQEPLEAVKTFLKSPGPSGSPEEIQSGAKCPFSGVVSEAFAREGEHAGGEAAAAPAARHDEGTLPWSKGAEERLSQIPSFVRPMAKMGIEKYARDSGFTSVTEEVLDQAKAKFGM